MVMVAQGHQIGQIRRSLVSPVHDMMDIGEDVVGATGEATSSVPPLDFATLWRGCQSLGATLEHGVTEGIIEGQGDRGVATDASDGLATQQPHPLDFRPTGTALQEGQVGMGHHEEVRSGSWCKARIERQLGIALSI